MFSTGGVRRFGRVGIAGGVWDGRRGGPLHRACRRCSIEGVGRVAKDPVEEMLRLSAEASASAERVRARRVALSRFSLVWWQGGAAEAYRAAVLERVNGLAQVQAELELLSVACHDLAARYAVETVVESLGPDVFR